MNKLNILALILLSASSLTCAPYLYKRSGNTYSKMIGSGQQIRATYQNGTYAAFSKIPFEREKPLANPEDIYNELKSGYEVQEQKRKSMGLSSEE